MKLGLHEYANKELLIKLEPENDTEKNILKYFYGSAGTNKNVEGTADSYNGIFIKTGKRFR